MSLSSKLFLEKKDSLINEIQDLLKSGRNSQYSLQGANLSIWIFQKLLDLPIVLPEDDIRGILSDFKNLNNWNNINYNSKLKCFNYDESFIKFLDSHKNQ